MNIVCLLGSPRAKSNSSTIAKRFIAAAEKSGAKVKSYTLNDLKYRGCQGCMACKTKLEKCVLKDDLAEVLDAVQQADVVVMASPVYYGEISSQLKGFIDRSFSYLKPDFMTNSNPVRFAPGKKLVFALSQGQPAEAFADIFSRYDFFFKWYGFSESHLIRACGVVGEGDIEARQEILSLAEETAVKLCSNQG
jgi:multimeric flavodoxin WrbA